MSPIAAKTLYKQRNLVNIAIVLAIFIPGVAWANQFHAAAAIDLALIVVCCALYFFVLDDVWGNFDCPHCGKRISIATPWTCGSCGERNEKTADFPFMHQCRNCSASPKAYECHHCNGIAFLSLDEQAEGCATYAPPLTAAARSARHEEQVTDRRRKIEVAELDEKIAGLNAAKEARKPFSKDKMMSEMEARMAQVLSIHEFIRRERARIDKEYGNDPDMHDMALDALEDLKLKYVK